MELCIAAYDLNVKNESKLNIVWIFLSLINLACETLSVKIE